MKFTETFTVVQGDRRPSISIQIVDSSKAKGSAVLDIDDPTTMQPVNITEPLVQMNFMRAGNEAVLDTINCIKLSPYTDGKIEIAWKSGTLNVEPGVYIGEVFLTYTGGGVWTMPQRLKFRVEKSSRDVRVS